MSKKPKLLRCNDPRKWITTILDRNCSYTTLVMLDFPNSGLWEYNTFSPKHIWGAQTAICRNETGYFPRSGTRAGSEVYIVQRSGEVPLNIFWILTLTWNWFLSGRYSFVLSSPLVIHNHWPSAHTAQLRFGMLKAWVQNENLAEIDIEERYTSWVANLRSDNYVTVLWRPWFCW